MWCWPTRFTLRRRFSTFCSLTANTLWRCSRMNGATSIRTWLDYLTMWHLSRVAIDRANATGGIFLAYNIFHVFLARNVKPCVRQGKTQIFWARLIAAELYSEVAPAGMSP